MDATVPASARIDLLLLSKTVSHHCPLGIFEEPAASSALHHSLKWVYAAMPQRVPGIQRLIESTAPAVALDTFESAENGLYAGKQYEQPTKDQEWTTKKEKEESKCSGIGK